MRGTVRSRIGAGGGRRRCAARLLVGLLLLASATACDAGSSGVADVTDATVLTIDHQRDGDSFVASDGVEYRVGMVNTPEVGDCGAADASGLTAELLRDGFTVEDYALDTHGRHVARVRYLADGGGDLGVELARRGYADDRYLAGFRDEHPAYATALDDAFALAELEGAGLWRSCWADTG